VQRIREGGLQFRGSPAFGRECRLSDLLGLLCGRLGILGLDLAGCYFF